MHLYEYAVIRFVPNVEREEFVNVGVIMMCKRQRWIKTLININKAKVEALTNGHCDFDLLAHQLELFTAVSSGAKEASPIASTEAEERFRWLTAVKSSCLQTSRPHPGKTEDLDSTLQKLFESLVM